MRSKLNLDLLLDNEHLTPQQERAIRRLIDYNLKYVDNQLVVRYQFKGSSMKEWYTVNYSSKLNIYKHMMYGLLSVRFRKHVVASSEIGNPEILDIVNREDWNYFIQNPIKTEAQKLYSLVQEIYG